jgi:hypothetical protein
MSLPNLAFLLGILLALLPAQGADAHGTGTQGNAAESVSTSPSQLPEIQLPEIRLTVTVDPDAPIAQIVQVARGMHVRLSVFGVGTSTLHLHGYDIEANAAPDHPAMFNFDSIHTGRFALEMHLDNDILGRNGKAVLYIEVREQ